MLFLLTTLNVAYVISTPRPEDKEDETVEEIRKKNKWDNDDFICRGHILNDMVDSLFDVYQNLESAKELWNILEGKYMTEDATSKKFLVSSFNDYKFVDSRPIMDQFHEMQRIYSNLKHHNIKMDEVFVVSSIIDKLPYSWRDVKKTLKHKEEDIDINQLGTHLQIEVSIRAQESGGSKNPNISSINVVEESSHMKGKRKVQNGNSSQKGKAAKITPPDKSCWICGKLGHQRRIVTFTSVK